MKFIIVKKELDHLTFESWAAAEIQAKIQSRQDGYTYFIAKLMHEVEEEFNTEEIE